MRAALVAATLAACAAPAPRRETPPVVTPDPALQRLLDPRPATPGPAWLGADVASSVSLADGRIVWVFGDTLLGSVRDACPPPAHYCDRDVREDEDDGMIASSVAIMRPNPADGFFPIEPFWNRTNGAAAPALPNPGGGEFLWPMAVTRAGDVLVVSASRHTRASGLFSLGSMLLRVRDADRPPAAWHWEMHVVAAAEAASGNRPQLTWMTALVPDGEWIHVVGERAGPRGSETLLARFPVADVAADVWAPHLEFLAGAGDRWSPTYVAAESFVVPGLPGTTEATVHRHPRLGWYTFRILPLTFDVRLYTADALAGPWRDRGVVYRLPPRWREPRRPDGAAVYAAYAVKAHPWLSDGDDLVLTYNVNLLDGTYESAAAAAEREDGFYVPQVVRVAPWPP